MERIYFYLKTGSSHFEKIDTPRNSSIPTVTGIFTNPRLATFNQNDNNKVYQDIDFVIVDNVFLMPNIGDFSLQLLEFFFSAKKLKKNPMVLITHKENKKNVRDTLFDNSSIWFRTIYVDDNFTTELNDAIYYFECCSRLELYKQESAHEYIDYHLRIQRENYISGDHKIHVLPNTYGSETDIHNTQFNDKYLNKIGLRILLIDDKINCVKNEMQDDKDGLFTECNSDSCESKTKWECKLRIIKNLLSLNFSDTKIKLYWDSNSIKTFYRLNKFDKKTIFSIFDDKTNNSNEVRLFGVKDIETAQALLESKKSSFDLILLDFLLDKNTDEKEGKKYGTSLFDQSSEKSKFLQDNGLLNRLWVFPITAFGQSFFSKLNSMKTQLIDKNWYIYTPTNPIVCPYRFVYNLNSFISLMIEQSDYEFEDLVNYFVKSYDKVKDYQNSQNRFNAIMGADYVQFMQLYGSRLNIIRDMGNSLFANSIYNHFYGIEESRRLIAFNSSLQQFYYLASNCTTSATDKNKLEDSLERILYYNSENEKLKKGIQDFRKIIREN